MCSRCGRQRPDHDPLAALTWASEQVAPAGQHTGTTDTDTNGTNGTGAHDGGNGTNSRPPELRWLCPDCTRAHVRDIESKLDQSWW